MRLVKKLLIDGVFAPLVHCFFVYVAWVHPVGSEPDPRRWPFALLGDLGDLDGDAITFIARRLQDESHEIQTSRTYRPAPHHAREDLASNGHEAECGPTTPRRN